MKSDIHNPAPDNLSLVLSNLFHQWCKETKRSGGVLVGKSIYEFFNWLQEKTK